MPTLSKPQLIERESPWRRESDRIQRELCRKGVPILAGLGYYAERDLPVPEADQLMLVQDVEALKPITGALTFAAAASEELSDAGVIATLRKSQEILPCCVSANCRLRLSGTSPATTSAAMRNQAPIGRTSGAISPPSLEG